MIASLTTFERNPLSDFTQTPSTKAFTKNSLRQRMENLRQRMNQLEAQTTQIAVEQVKIQQVAVLIQTDQAKIDQTQRISSVYKKSIDQNHAVIKQNHLEMMTYALYSTQMWQGIYDQALRIQIKQSQLYIHLRRAEQQEQGLSKQVVWIHQTSSIIKDCLHEVREKRRDIEHRGLLIQTDHQVIKTELAVIKEKGKEVQTYFPSFHQQKQLENKANSEISLSLSRLKRIQDFCLWIIATCCQKIAQVRHFVSNLWKSSPQFSREQINITDLISNVSSSFFVRATY